MAYRNDGRKRVKRIALFMTIAACVLMVGLVFLSFCMIEALVLFFTGGAFSLVFPAMATAVMLFAVMALALAAGGAE